MANVHLPGIVKAISGFINVTKQLNATGIPGTTRLLATLQKNDFLVDYICKGDERIINYHKKHHINRPVFCPKITDLHFNLIFMAINA